MSSTTPRFLAALALLAGLAGTVLSPASALAADAPPHAWLYGSWAGGLYPAPSDMTAAECNAHPTFIVTQDAVLHATLAQPGFVQNLIASVRGTPQGTVFTLAPSGAEAPPGSLPGIADFGCADSTTLRVVKSGANQIAFPGCTAFPSPLVRCPAH
jgi:hypothetical protein